MSIQLSKTNTKNLNILVDGSPLKMKVPKSVMPFGFSVTDYGYGPNKNLVISITDDEFLSSMREVECNVISEISKMSKDIFNREVGEDEIFNMFNSNMSDDRLRIKHTKDTVLFDKDGKVMHANIFDGDFSKWSVTCNFLITGVYFMNKKIGLILKAHHVKLFEPEKDNSGYLFIDSSSDSD